MKFNFRLCMVLAAALVCGHQARAAGSSSGQPRYLTGKTVGQYDTLVSVSQGTNFVINFAATNVYHLVLATNDVNFAHCTNGSGTASIKIRPNGANRTLSFPTNWVPLTTNALTLSGTLWQATLTNAPATTGPQVAWISVSQNGTSQTNVTWVLKLSP